MCKLAPKLFLLSVHGTRAEERLDEGLRCVYQQFGRPLMTTNISVELPARTTPPACLSAIEKLLNRGEAVAEETWKSLSDIELDSEIKAYREGVSEISKELEARGVANSLEVDSKAEEAEGTARIPGVEVDRLL